MKFPGIELSILAAGVVLIALVCLAVVRVKPWLRLVVVFAALVIVGSFSYSLGIGIERFRWTSGQEYWFRKYSSHLHSLVGEKNYDDLTNAVVRFDTRYSQDPRGIKDVMYQILEIGPYYKEAVTTPPDPSLPPHTP
ncbi:MAG TPA: hypothetical protein VK846_05150 [Candidatus Limnocylindria bacterium]|nr:hypothetical protein [Candidatus Limnocylindria bacterium]